jgi:hypothetical protein
MTKRYAKLLAFAVVGTAMLGYCSLAVACPSCKQALSADGSQGDVGRGIYYSILFMMSMPFAIVGAWAGLIYRAVKRQERTSQSLDDGQSLDEDGPQESYD